MNNIITGILCLIVVLASLLWCVQFYYKRKRIYKQAEKFNGPPTMPFFGNALQCFMGLDEIAGVVLEGMRRYKSPTRIWFGSKLALHVWDPKQLEVVLNSPHALEKDPLIYKTTEFALGNGLLSAPVEKWKRHRRAIAPIFNQKNVESFFDTCRKHADNLVAEMRPKDGLGPFNAKEYLMTTTLKMILDVLLDFDANKCNLDVAHFIGCLEQIQEATIKKCTNVWYLSDFIFYLSMGKKLKNAIGQYNKYMDTILEEWKKNTLTKHNRRDNETTEQTRRTKCEEYLLSDVLSDKEAKFTSDELRDEVRTLIVAGFESTASTIGYTLIALGMHPEIQEKAFQEITQTLRSNEQLSHDALEKLEFVDRVVKETMRAFPSGAGIARLTTQDIELDGHTVPSGTSILIGLLSLLRDPKVWPDPTKFDPDRFLPEEVDRRHPYSYIPFSAGARNCIGFRLAFMFIKIVVVELIRHYQIVTSYKSVEDVSFVWIILFQPAGGYQIGLKSRT